MTDIFDIAAKFRKAVRNGTGTSVSAKEIRLLHRGGIVSALYRLEEEQELETACPENDNLKEPINLATAGSGSERSGQVPSGKSVGMTPEQEQRGVSQRGFKVVS